MKVKTDCHGEVEVLDDVWYTITNYQGIYGDDMKAKCIGIVTMKNIFGEVRTYIGLGYGEDVRQDIITVLDAGVPFYF